MKIIVKISGLYLLLCCSVITAQDLQKWYADDIYYNSNEKETNIIEIVEYSVYDNEIDTLEETFDNQMSYTSRINRFHRDYYGTSLGFNYGYFHDPFLFNGFGFNYGFDPFFETYKKYDFLKGKNITVERNNDNLSGSSDGISEDGALIIVNEIGRHRIINGSIVHIEK